MKIKIDRADSLFSQWVRLRDRQCVKCGSAVQFNDKGMPVTHQASHFMGRGKESTRFEPLNVDTLCMGCHMFFTAHPAEHYRWQVERKGEDVIDKLVLQSNTYKKKDRKLEAMYWSQQLKV